MLPLILIISGPAGSGKGTIVKDILELDKRFVCSVSATSRPMLKGEADGVSYHFISREEFEKMIEQDRVIEYTEYCGNFYGTPVSEVDAANENGKHLILEIEVDGAMQIKKKYPGAVLIMVLPPSARVQEERLRRRGRDSEESILRRLARAHDEVALLDSYDYVVINEDGRDMDAAGEIIKIADAEMHSTARNIALKKSFFE